MAKLHQSRGSALLVSLVLLTVITIGAMVAMQRSTLQLRMVTNMQHQQQIFNGVYGHLDQLENEIALNYSAAIAALGPLVDQERVRVAAGQDIGSIQIDPFAQVASLQPAQLPAVMSGVTTQTRVEFFPDQNSKNLKASKGNSQSSVTYYYFGNASNGIDNNNNIRTSQETGIAVLATAN